MSAAQRKFDAKYDELLKSMKTRNIEDQNRWEFQQWLAHVPKVEYKWINKIINGMLDIYRNTSLNNITKLNYYKTSVLVDPTNYICSVFKVTSIAENITANYGYLYSLDKQFYNILDPKKTTETPAPILYCVAPALVSQDGEYRSRIYKFDQARLFEIMFPQIYADIEVYCLKKIEDENLSLEYENFYPQLNIEEATQLLDNVIVKHRIATTFFMQFWLVEISQSAVGLQENHINPKYNRIFFRDIKQDIAFFVSLCKKHGKEHVLTAVKYLMFPVGSGKKDGKTTYIPLKYGVGQKLIPLNVREVQEPFNIKYGPWREIYITQLVTGLFVSYVAPGFPIMLSWFYVKNSRHGLFDNEQQAKRLENSERAFVIDKKLRETQRIMFAEEKKFINEDFQILHDKLEDPIDYIKSNIMMSNVTLGFLNEYVGRTFYDIPNLIKSSIWIDDVGDLLNDNAIWDKYIWDMCYSVLAYNVKYGIAHSDLHLNNGCINTNIVTKPTTEKNYELYSAAGNWFMLPVNKARSCIIDYSRAVVSPGTIKDYHYFKDFPEAMNDFIDDQNDRIVYKLLNMFPTTITPIESRLRELLVSDFDKIFRVYSAVDMYDFASKLLKFLGSNKLLNKHAEQLLRRIVKVTEHYLTNLLIRVVNNPDLNIDWPMMVVLRECFSDYIIDPNIERKELITDVWILDREAKYGFHEFSVFPPWLKDQRELSPTGKIKQSEHSVIMNNFRKAYEKYRAKSMDMVEYIAERHRLKYR